VKLLDPGYFGAVDCQEGASLCCAITTSGYYPLLEPDDLFAFGIMLWEFVCQKHPLEVQDGSQPGQIGPGLESWVRSRENVGQFSLQPMLQLRRPSELVPGMLPELEAVLLTGMGLGLDHAARLERAPGFKSFGDLAASLEPLLGRNLSGLQ